MRAVAIVLAALLSGCASASASDTGAIRSVIVRTARAEARGDVKTFCAGLTAKAQRAATGGQIACLNLTRDQLAADPSERARLEHLTVGKITIDGTRASADELTHYPKATAHATIKLVRRRGAWRIDERPDGSFVGRQRVYRIPSESMVPTYKVGSVVLADPQQRTPKLGDVVIFYAPKGADENRCASKPAAGAMCAGVDAKRSDQKFIKRVVGLPGDTLALRAGKVIRNGTPIDEPDVSPCDDGGDCDFPQPITVPPGSYFVLGDNRGASDDSRYWGAIRGSWIIGTVTQTIS